MSADPWMPVQPKVTCGSLCRSPVHLRQVVQQFDVVNNPRYRARPGATYCNIFLWDVTRALSVEVPHWWLGQEYTANQIAGWLLEYSDRFGWRKVAPKEAEERARAGFPTVAVWRNPNRAKPGHLALLVPSGAGEGIRIAQAGASNFEDGPVERGFGQFQPAFWTHD